MAGRNGDGVVRLYQVWQGNERFFCGGRCIAGPNWKALLGTATLIIAPLVVYFVLVAPVLEQEINWAVPAVAGVLGVASLLFLFRTGCIDPGILMRQEPDEEYRSGRKNKTKEEIVNGHRVLVRYNETCHFYQPPRAHHCSVNDNCIEKFDHHCPWVGTTIGRRNYRWFLLFIFSASLLCMYVCATGVLSVVAEYDSLQDQKKAGEKIKVWHAFEEAPAAVALAAYTALFFLFVGGLSIFHIYLVSTNQTTYENFRYGYDRSQNPYDQGCSVNCWQVWCQGSPLPPIDFRQVQKAAPITSTDALAATGASSLPMASFEPGEVSLNMDMGMGPPWGNYAQNSRVQSGVNDGYSGGSRPNSRTGSYKVGATGDRGSRHVVAPPSRIPSGASSRKTPLQKTVGERRVRSPSSHSSNHSSNNTSYDAASLSGVEVQVTEEGREYRGSRHVHKS